MVKRKRERKREKEKERKRERCGWVCEIEGDNNPMTIQVAPLFKGDQET
jgi:hypothetical protein